MAEIWKQWQYGNNMETMACMHNSGVGLSEANSLWGYLPYALSVFAFS